MLVTELVSLYELLSLFFFLLFTDLKRLMLASMFTKLTSTTLYLFIDVDLRLLNLLLFLLHFLFKSQIVLLLNCVGGAFDDFYSLLLFLTFQLILLKFELVEALQATMDLFVFKVHLLL